MTRYVGMKHTIVFALAFLVTALAPFAVHSEDERWIWVDGTSPVLQFKNPCPEAGPETCHITLTIEEGYEGFYEGLSIRCLPKMEAAMRAMDPYLMSYNELMNEYPHTNFETHVQDAEKAMRQWEAVKKECWRQP